MRSAGIDIGSRAIKLVLVENGEVVERSVRDTGTDPLAACRAILEGHKFQKVTCTGYGRHLFKQHWPEAEVMTEIRAVAIGARHLHPQCRTILDIGGQDSKAIELDERGSVRKFVMNDRCAAGTGQFLEMMATTLGFTREGFEEAAGAASRACQLSSLCSVFAQTEVVSMIAKGTPRDEIALGVLQSIATRTHALAGTITVTDPILFTGGCALNRCLISLLEAAFRREVTVPARPQTVAALGCALQGQP